MCTELLFQPQPVKVYAVNKSKSTNSIKKSIITATPNRSKQINNNAHETPNDLIKAQEVEIRYIYNFYFSSFCN